MYRLLIASVAILSGCQEKESTTPMAGSRLGSSVSPKKGSGSLDPDVDPIFVSPDDMGIGNFDSRNFDHVVVIPDVHGDSEFFARSLWTGFKEVEGSSMDFEDFEKAILAVAENVEFVGKGDPVKFHKLHSSSKLSKKLTRVALVQLGDIPDRGDRSFLCFQILASIEEVIGWKVIQLYGNHETGLLDLGTRRFGYESYSWVWNYIDSADVSNYRKDGLETMQGVVEMLRPNSGGLWNFLTSKNYSMVRIGQPKSDAKYVIDHKGSADTLFVHAGLEPVWLASLVDPLSFTLEDRDVLHAEQGDALVLKPQGEILERCTERKMTWDSFIATMNSKYTSLFKKNPSQAPDTHGPFWTRHLTERDYGMSEPDICKEIDQMLVRLRVSRMVVGHTPQRSHRPEILCDGKFIVADVTMSRGFRRGGQPFALVFSHDVDRKKGASLKNIVAYFTHPKSTGINEILKLH